MHTNQAESNLSDDSRQQDVCSICGLQLGRGSMTAWVLQQERCRCNTPNSAAIELTSAQSPDSHKSMEAFPATTGNGGQILNERYELLERLGHGGVGVVYKAKDLVTNQLVAVKLMRKELAEYEPALLRFKREVETTCELNHPNLGKIHGYGCDRAGQPYLVMELVSGENLADVLSKNGNRLEQKRALNLFIQICEGLAVAHGRSIIHRDLKPRNIIVYMDRHGHESAKIVDFGFARVDRDGSDSLSMTQSGEVFGSPLYMSPEHCLGQKLDVRSDIYSLGCLMYETLAGCPPLAGDNILATVAKQVKEEPQLLQKFDKSISKSLEGIVLKCLAKEPLMRYQSVCHLLDDLNKVKHGRLTSAPAVKRTAKKENSPQLSKLRYRHGVDVGIVAGIVLLNVVVLSLIFVFWSQTVSKNSVSNSPLPSTAKTVEVVQPNHLEPKVSLTATKGGSKSKLEEHVASIPGDVSYLSKSLAVKPVAQGQSTLHPATESEQHASTLALLPSRAVPSQLDTSQYRIPSGKTVSDLIRKAKLVDNNQTVNASVKNDRIIVSTIGGVHASDRDCKVSALLMLKEVVNHCKNIHSAQIYFFDPYSISTYRTVNVTANLVDLLNQGQSIDRVILNVNLTHGSRAAPVSGADSHRDEHPLSNRTAYLGSWNNPGLTAAIASSGQTIRKGCEVLINADDPSWTDTGLFLSYGDRVWLDTRSGGLWSNQNGGIKFNADGEGGAAGFYHGKLGPPFPRGSLIGKVGRNGGEFFVGTTLTNYSPPDCDGDLFLRFNDRYDKQVNWYADNSGSQGVRVFATKASH